jgi:peptidoglycan hydrolase CwlO-like protein
MADSFLLVSAMLGGVILGAFIAFIILKGGTARAYESGKSDAGRENAALAERINNLDMRSAEYKAEISEKNARIESLMEKNALLQEKLSVTETNLSGKEASFRRRSLYLTTRKRNSPPIFQSFLLIYLKAETGHFPHRQVQLLNIFCARSGNRLIISKNR